MCNCKISVVTVCLNAEDSIKETIESVLEQTYELFEYVIIDGQSTDRTLDIIDEYKKDFERKNISFSVYSEKDTGVYNAMNKAVNRCRGDWIHYLNAGDVFASQDVLEKFGSRCENDCEVLYGDYYKKREDKLVFCQAYDLKEIRNRMCFCHQAVITPKKVIQQFGFDEKYQIAADHKFFLQLYLSGIKFEYIPIPVAIFECGGISSDEIKLMKEVHQLKVECGVITGKQKILELWKCRVNCTRKRIQNFKQKIKDLKLNKKEAILVGALTLLILAAVCFASFHQSTGQEYIASHYDAAVKLHVGQEEMIQSWQANSRNISGFILQTDANQNTELTGKLRLRLKEQADEEEFLCEGEVGLSEITENGEYIFHLPEIKLELGRRYYFQIELLEGTQNTSIAVLSNSNYGGLLIDEQEYDGAIAGIILYQFSGNAAWLVRIFLLLSGITFFLMLIFNRSFGEVFATTFGVIFVYLYLFGIFEQLEFGVRSLYVMGMLMAVTIPLFAVYKRRKLTELISPGMVAFWVLFFIYFILDRSVVAGKADDLSHWQLAVRDMWYFDSYPFHPGSTLCAMRYTPGFASLEYLFLYLYGSYREGIILLCCHTVGFAMLSVLYTKVSWKQCHKVLPLTALIAGFPLLLYQSHYGILYVDAYLGIIGAYLLICYFTEGHNFFNVFRITFGSALLIMTKEMGLVIAGTVYLIIFGDIIIKNKAFIINKNVKAFVGNKCTKEYFLSGVLSLFSFITWQIYIVVVGGRYGLNNTSTNILKMFGVAKAYAAKTEEILLASLGNAGVVQKAAEQIMDTPNVIANATPKETIIEMIRWLFQEREFWNRSYAEATLIVLLLCGALGIAGLYQKLRIPMKQIIISLLMGTGIYTVCLVICYMFLFKEASAIPAAKRYMGSYFLLFLIVIAGIMIVKANIAEEKSSWKQPFIWIISLFILLCVPKNHPYYTTEENFGGYFTTWAYHQTIGEVFRSFADKDEKIYYVEYSNSDLIPQYNYLTFLNAVVPNLTQGLNGGWKPVVSGDSPYQNYTVQYTAKEWEQLLAQQYTYVYLRYVDDYFVENYCSLFEDERQIVSGSIFKVNVSDDNVSLQRIAFKDLN